MADDEALAACKRAIFDKLSPRRRTFIEKIGYDAWNPFQPPMEPVDRRLDPSRHTARELVDAFLAANPGASDALAKGAWEVCLGVMAGSERHLGMYAFCRWYRDMLAREGIAADLGPRIDEP